ncbi:hypothetical protein [Parasitella parasitica]|uniref:Uncharacterized protein n=1 Tax=Parasitella parasitica TaxID=35722 RepID=A0A0B7N0L2_9FUNG|nr:hypothetical protein [Parasitella parasitica]
MNLEAAFRSDLNGWLEYENKLKRATTTSQYQLQVSDNSLRQLLETLDLTLSYHKYSSESLKALHNTVFYNAIHRQSKLQSKFAYTPIIEISTEYAVDFNVVNFPMAINHYTLHYVCDRFDLHKYTCYKLWEMPAQDALQFMIETFSTTNKPLRHFHPIFFKIIQKNVEFNGITDQQIQNFIYGQIKIDTGVDFASCHLTFIFRTIYDCIMDNARISRIMPEKSDFLQKSTERLIDFTIEISKMIFESSVSITEECRNLFQLIFDMSGKPFLSYWNERLQLPSIAIPIQTCQNVRTQQCSVKEDWHKLIQQKDANTTAHEEAFLDVNEKSGFDRLEKYVRQKAVKTNVAKCQLWCIFSIRNRASFWKSTLKVVVQFMDLWIDDIVENECEDIFASLIARENMMAILYDLILKHVQQYKKARSQDIGMTIMNLCLMLETCIDNAKRVDDALNLRDYILNQRPETDDIRLPTLGTIEFWNIPFEKELIKACNQITADNNYRAPQDLVFKLIKLSVIGPYQVIQELFMACARNKNQFKVIIPILNMLGNLCVFRASNSCSSLLMSVIRDSLTHLQKSNVLLSNQENIAQFIMGCMNASIIENYTETHPIILTPKCSLPDQPTEMLLEIADVLNELILQPLVEFTRHPATLNVQPVQFSLYLLNAFCQDCIRLPQSNWDNAQVIINESNLPAFLHCSSETFVHCLTFIMDLREQNEKHGVRLEDWEVALKCISKLRVIIRYGLDAKPSQFRLSHQYFETSLTDFDWKSQLLWYPLARTALLRVPNALVRITGTLNGLFGIVKDIAIHEDDNKIVGWYHLFMACKLSTELTDILFQNQAQWEYNLLLLWKHPMKNELLTNGLQHALHPKFSNSVSIEYPNLLKHFLYKLYDSFDFYTVLQDEHYYTDKSIIPIISQLSKNQGTRLYFSVLCITQLLATQPNDPNSGDLYYIACLVKMIQDMTQWSSISKDGQSASYNKLKEKLNQGTADERNDYCYYYPYLNTEKLKSDRALSILTLYHLCLSAIGMNQSQSDVIERLIMQIIEGLVDMESRQQFERMLRQQPSKRVSNWKKKSKSGINKCKHMRLRPILVDEEVQILKPVIAKQPYNSHRLLQVLGLSMPQNENQLNNGKILYFL